MITLIKLPFTLLFWSLRVMLWLSMPIVGLLVSLWTGHHRRTARTNRHYALVERALNQQMQQQRTRW
jgi:hypothetical protein